MTPTPKSPSKPPAPDQKVALVSTALKVHGLDCAEEVALLRAELEPLPGVTELGFDVLRAKMVVSHRANVSAEELVAAVARTGLRAELWKETPPGAADGGRFSWWDRRVLATVFSGALLSAGFLTHVVLEGWRGALGEGEITPPLARGLYLAATVAGAWFILPKAWRALVRLRPDMNLLMVAAVTGAVVLKEDQEAGTVSFLFALSLSLESWSVGRARRAIEALMALTPRQARVADGHGERMTQAEDVAIGSEIIIRPGEKIPLDGVIQTGTTSVDQAPITGESVPVERKAGEEVFAGTINLDGAIHVRTTKLAEDTTLARIVRLVGDAQSKRSPSEQWVERFARYYTPAVMIAALAIMLLPPLFAGQWGEWFYRGLVLLVIACPCALVISTPVSIVAAIASAARRGVLVKGGPFIEAPARLRAIAFDKTGTLTIGRPEVVELVPLNGHTREELLHIAAAIEAKASHHLGRAIVRAARAEGLEPAPAEDYRAIAGKGAKASLEGKPVWIGSYRLLEEACHASDELRAKSIELESRGLSLVAVGESRHVCGLIGLADRVRDGASDVLGELRSLGIEHIAMLTGDHRAAAQDAAERLGVTEVRAELLPEDKVTAIEALVARHGEVAMIGDGVNDAPALARATLGIAMGVAGSDAALETADIALMGDDLTALPWLVRHARRTLGVIRQNIYASLGVKGVFVLLTLVGYASLWGAIAADTGMSLLVVVNGLRLLRAGNRGAH